MVYISLDEFTERRMLKPSYIEWLDRHQIGIMLWVNNNIHKESIPTYINKMIQEPAYPYLYHVQDTMDNEEKLNKILFMMRNKRGRMDVIVGRKRSGKTLLGFVIAHQLALKGEKVWYFGPPTVLPPFFAGRAMDINKIPPNVTVLIDEMSVQFFNATSRQEQIDFIRLLPIIAHSGRNAIGITQSLCISDVNFVRTADSLIFTSQTTFYSKMERIKIDKELFWYMPARMGNFLYVDNENLYSIDFIKPHWWKEAYSTPYYPIQDELTAYKFAATLMFENQDNKQIIIQGMLKGWEFTEPMLIFIRMVAENYGKEDLFKLKDIEFLRLMNEGFNSTSVQELNAGKIDTRRLEFTLSPILEQSKRELMKRDPRLIAILNKKVNQLFLDDIYVRVKGQREGNLIASIYGPTGSGKSLGALALYEIICSIAGTGTLHTVYTDNEVMENIKTAGLHDVIHKDEQQRRAGEGSGTEEEEIKLAENTLRKKRIHIIWCGPDIKIHQHHFSLQAWGINDKAGKSQFILRDNGGNPLGYIILGRPSKATEEAYNKQKDGFLDRVQARQYSKTDFKAIAEELLEDPDTQYATNALTRMSLIREKYPHLSVSEAQRIDGWMLMITRRTKGFT